MIVTDRRFIFTDRNVAMAGFAAERDLMADEYSRTQDLDILAEKKGSVVVRFTDVSQVSMRVEALKCSLQIAYKNPDGEKKLRVTITGPPSDIALAMPKDAVLSMIREVYGDVLPSVSKGVIAVNISYFKSLSEKLKSALPTSIVISSEWP